METLRAVAASKSGASKKIERANVHANTLTRSGQHPFPENTPRVTGRNGCDGIILRDSLNPLRHPPTSHCKRRGNSCSICSPKSDSLTQKYTDVQFGSRESSSISLRNPDPKQVKNHLRLFKFP